MDQTAQPDVYDTYTKDTFGADPTDPAYHKQEAGAPGSASDELDGGLPIGGAPEQPPLAAADSLPNPTPDLAVTGSPEAADEGSKLLTNWDAAALKPNASDTDPAVIARGKQLAAAVQAERDSVTVNPKLKTVAPMKDAAGKMKEPGGLRYGGANSPPPDALADTDPKKAALNQALWSELGAREGGVSAMNTWDTAGLTVGAGFAATGQLPAVLDTFLKSAPEAKEALMKVGFTCEGGKFMAVDPTSGKVCEGKAAIDLVKADPKVLSRMIEILEDPENAKKFADAEWKAIESMAGAVPKDVADKWDQQTIVMVAHYVHWTGTPWTHWAKIGPDVAALVREGVKHAHKDKAAGDATVIIPMDTSILLGSSKGCGKKGVTGPGPLPDDIATVSYAGHVFLSAGTKPPTYWHLLP